MTGFLHDKELSRKSFLKGGGALVVGRGAVAATADRVGVFVYGFAPEDYPRG